MNSSLDQDNLESAGKKMETSQTRNAHENLDIIAPTIMLIDLLGHRDANTSEWHDALMNDDTCTNFFESRANADEGIKAMINGSLDIVTKAVDAVRSAHELETDEARRSLEQNVETLNVNIATTQRELTKIKALNAELIDQQANLQSQIKDLAETKTQHEQQLEDRNEEVRNLNRKIVEMQGNARQRPELRKAQEEINDLKNDIALITAERNSLLESRTIEREQRSSTDKLQSHLSRENAEGLGSKQSTLDTEDN